MPGKIVENLVITSNSNLPDRKQTSSNEKKNVSDLQSHPYLVVTLREMGGDCLMDIVSN